MVGALWNSFWLVPLYAALLTAAVLLGRRLARWEEQGLGAPRQSRVGPFERSVGAMLAILIGFTFALTGGDFREAQATLHRECDAVAEAYRWGHLLPKADRTWVQDNLRAYADLLVRRDAGSTRGPEPEDVNREIQSEQATLWEGLAARRGSAADRAPYDACLRAVNQFTQAYYLRYYLDRRRLPGVMVLFLLGAPLLLGFLVGYTSESQGRQFAVLAGLVILFMTATVYLIWEVDHPGEGWIRPDRRNLIDLAAGLRDYLP
jgi:hypothetical protein